MVPKLVVIGFVVAMLGMLLGLHFYTDERGRQSMLAEVQCNGLLPTVFELQGTRLAVSQDETCDLIRSIATMHPTEDAYHNDPNDPWHYYGRMRILPKDDAWFLIFIARASNGFRPEFSLQHRKGAGWTVIGQFDAAALLKRLGASNRLDTAKLRSPQSLTPTDQEQPM